MSTVRIIGIGGPSGSGKSSLAECLAGALPEGASTILALDSYYLPLDHLSPDDRAATNFDHPGAIDWELFVSHLAELRAGRAVAEPVYRFDLHTRDVRSRIARPARYVIVEGILALHRADVRREMDLKIYIETGERECFRRRLKRDTVERGRTPGSVARQYEATVRPMAEQYVWPTRQYAGLIISGEQSYTEAVTIVLARLETVNLPRFLEE